MNNKIKIKIKTEPQTLFIESDTQINSTYDKIAEILTKSKLSTMSCVFILSQMLHSLHNPPEEE